MPSVSTASPTAFERVWKNDKLRDLLLTQTDEQDLLSLRLVSRDFAGKVTPHAFKDVSINFRSTTFTKPARMAALKRIGMYVRRLKFNMAYCLDTLLPPLLEPTSGSEIEFVYTPDCEMRKPELSHSRVICQNDADKELSDLLIKQYPPLYHAATNVPSFIRAFSYMPNLKYLTVSTPTEDEVVPSTQSIVDYAIISLRIAIERNHLRKLDHLTLLPIQPHLIRLLNPLFGPGARPNSLPRWQQIKKLTVHMPLTSGTTQLKQLHSYLHALSGNLQSFVFHWLPPIPRPSLSASSSRSSFGTFGGKEQAKVAPRRPTSSDTSYFPATPPPETFHRGANPLSLHLSSFLQPRFPRAKTSSHSLPSMTSASTLSSMASLSSSPPSNRSSPSSSPTRQHDLRRKQHQRQATYPPVSSSSPSSSSSSSRPKLRCQTSYRRRVPVFSPTTGLQALSFPKLGYFFLDSISCSAGEIAAFIDAHADHLVEFKLEHTTLEPSGGNWDDALAPLARLTGEERWRKQTRGGESDDNNSGNRSGSGSEGRSTRAPKVKRKPVTPCRKPTRRYEEDVPLMLGPELASPIELSPVRIGPFYESLNGECRTPKRFRNVDSIAAEIGLELGPDGRTPIAELAPEDERRADDEGEEMERRMKAEMTRRLGNKRTNDRNGLCGKTQHVHEHDADAEVILIGPHLSPSFGLPGVEASPLLSMKAGMGRPLYGAGQYHGYGGGVGMGANMSMNMDISKSMAAALAKGRAGGSGGSGSGHAAGLERGVRTGAKLLSSQKALEDGVRKLLAQTVFPWF